MKRNAILLAIVLAVACGTSIEAGGPDSTTSTAVSASSEHALLVEARTAWASADRPWYRYLYLASCECDQQHRGPNLVLVEGSSVSEVTYRGTADVEQPLAATGVGWTVEELFDMIDRSIERGWTMS